MKHRDSLSSIKNTSRSAASSPTRLYGSPTKKKQVVPYSPRSPNKYKSFFSVSGKVHPISLLSEKQKNTYFSPPKNRTISRKEFATMLETPQSHDFKDSFLGQSLFDLSIGLRSLDSVLKQILNFRLNAPLKYYSYSSLLTLISASSLCPPDAVLQLLSIGKVMITKHNYAKPKYLRVLIKVTKYLINKNFYYVSYGKNMQDKPKRKLDRLLRIFTDYLEIPPIGLEGKYETSQIEDIMSLNQSLNDERLEKDIQRRKRNRQRRENELKNNNKFLSESDDYENDHTEIAGNFSFESDLFDSQSDKANNSIIDSENKDTQKNQEEQDIIFFEKRIDDLMKEKENENKIVINPTENKDNLFNEKSDNNIERNESNASKTENDKNEDLLQSNTNDLTAEEDEHISQNENILDEKEANIAEDYIDKDLTSKDNVNLPIKDSIDNDFKENNINEANKDEIDAFENITSKDDNIKEESEHDSVENDDKIKGGDTNSITSNKDIDNLLAENESVNSNVDDALNNLLNESENGNGTGDSDLYQLLVESDNGNSTTENDIDNLLVDNNDDNNSTENDLDNLLANNNNGKSTSNDELDNLIEKDNNNGLEENELNEKPKNENYIDTKSQTEEVDKKNQSEKYVDEKSQTDNEFYTFDDNFPTFSHNNNEQRSNFDDYDRMSSRSWKSSLTESIQITIDIEPENTNQNGEQNIQLRQLEDSDPNVRSIERFFRSTDTIYERREKGIKRMESLTLEQQSQIHSLAKLFNNWKTAYASSRVVWNTMKADDKFDVNILLSQIPVSYGDFLIEALTTFAQNEGIIIQKMESPM